MTPLVVLAAWFAIGTLAALAFGRICRQRDRSSLTVVRRTRSDRPPRVCPPGRATTYCRRRAREGAE